MENFRAYPFIIPLSRKATSANTFTIKTKSWRPGDIIRVRHVSVSNEITDGTIVHVGVIRDEHAIYIKTLTLTTKTHFYKVILDVEVPSDYRVIVKIITPTSGDMIFVNVFGTLICCDRE